MKTLVTGALGATDAELDTLRGMGLEITLHPDERQPVETPEQYEAVICNGLFLYNDISRFTGLKFIQLTSAGLDRVPLDYIHRDIEIHNAAGVYSVPMAEWTMMRILELYKNAARLYENQSAHRWEKDRTWRELSGKTACIVGFGAYGQETAKRLKAFDVAVCVVNRTRKDSPYVDAFYPLSELNAALEKADIVILAVALTEETRHLFNKARLEAIKPGAILINAARGGLIDEAALLAALETRHLAGAALDVFEQEPYSIGHPLWNIGGTLISPHNSFVSDRAHQRLLVIIQHNIADYKRD